MAGNHDEAGSWDFGEPSTPGENPARPAEQAVTGRGVREPLELLIAAAACTVPSILIGFLSWHPGLAILGWLLGGLAAIGFVTAFAVIDTKRRADPYYLVRRTGPVLCRIVIGAAVLGTALNAWHFADYVSRVRVL